jgi:dihydroorotate dehydrogenase (fumarate)
MRFVGLMAGNVEASLCGSNGIHSGSDAVEMLLAGADVFQVVSTLYRNSPDVIPQILNEISEWMERKGYESLDDFRGKLSVNKNPDKLAYKRAQYVKMLLRSDEYIERPRLI